MNKLENIISSKKKNQDYNNITNNINHHNHHQTINDNMERKNTLVY